MCQEKYIWAVPRTIGALYMLGTLEDSVVTALVERDPQLNSIWFSWAQIKTLKDQPIMAAYQIPHLQCNAMVILDSPHSLPSVVVSHHCCGLLASNAQYIRHSLRIVCVCECLGSSISTMLHSQQDYDL